MTYTPSSPLRIEKSEKTIWQRLKNLPLVFSLGAYLIALGLARLFVILRPDFQFWVSELHLHHYYLGIILLLISIGVILYTRTVSYELLIAILFGTGLGVIVDEIGLILTQGQEYWSPLTYPIAVIFFILLSVSILLQNNYHQQKSSAEKVRSSVVSSYQFVKMPFTIAFLSYLGWFGLARGFTILFPTFQVYLGEIHLQHFNLGLIFLVVCAWVSVYYRELKYEGTIAMLYGGGLGLIINQLAELLTEANYWDPINLPFFIFFACLLGLLAIYTHRRS